MAQWMLAASTFPHAGHSGPRIVAHVRYRETPAAIASAAAMVAYASRNRAALLKKFLRYQEPLVYDLVDRSKKAASDDRSR